MATATVDRSLNPLRQQVANVFGLVVVLAVNALANALPINGITSGEVSDRFPTFVTPAGYVFAIWGVIYALLTVFAVYQALPAQRADPGLRRLGYAFALSCVFNATWLVAWHHLQIWLSLALIVGLVVTLGVCYERVRATSGSPARWLAVQLPFSVYLGWVTVATVANTAVALVAAGVDGGSAGPLWGAVAIAAATAVGAAMLVRRGDVVFAAVLLWAFIGIAVAQADRSALIVAVAAVACVVLAATAVVTSRRRAASAPAA